MNENTELIDNFEEILKKQSTNKIPALYSNKAYTNPSKIESIKPQDIIKSVASKIKAMNNADCVISGKRVPKYLNKYNKSTFIPVNMLSKHDEVQKKPTNKFETQCVSDTQLFNIIQDAEALVGVDRGMTQEFETLFCAEQESDDFDAEKETNSTQKDAGFCIVDISLKEPDPNKTQTLIQLSQNTKKIEEQNVNVIETDTQIDGTQILNDCIDLEENIQQLDVLDDVEMPSSPIFNINPIKKPLVFNLESFEKFERIAAPIIEESVDFQSAKQIINSQLIGKELYIQTDIQIISNDDDEISPILSPITSIEKRKVDNIDLRSDYNKESDKNSDGSDKHILKDEILFSSDEENEYVQKSFHELPFTCALETSFYDRSDVLDKTMYVSFQTASNKSIQVETVSFTKAKSIFDELDNDLSVKGPTLTELVELCDVTDSKIAETNKVTKLDIQNTFKESEIVTGDFKSPLNEATGSPLDNLRHLDFVETNKGIEEVFKTDFNTLLTAPIIDDLKEENVNLDNNFVGFKTANEKSIDVSKEALIKSEAIFKDIHAKDQLNVILDLKVTQFKTDNEKSIDVSEESKDTLRNTDAILPKICEESKNDAFIKPTDSKRKFEGFITANNKRIKLSKIALERTRQIFHDIDLDEKDIPMETDPDQEIKIPDTIANDFEESLRIEKNSDHILMNNQELHSIDDVILKEFENEEMAHTQFMEQKEIKHHFVGVKTASNEGINISEEALAKTKNIFQDIDKCSDDFKDLVKENTSNNTTILKNNPMTTLIGFKTASNKKIDVSDQALAKTKSVFHDIDSLQLDDQVSSDCQTRDLVPEKDVRDYINQPSTSIGFEGFKTANNKVIKITESALSKTKNVFKDIDKEIILPINIKDTTQKDLIKAIDYKCQGFKTASNKNVQISTDALIKSKKLFENINKDFENEEKGTEIEPAFYGFQTANEDIEISKNALDKSQKLLQDLQVTTLENQSYKGFQTASKKPVSISAEALTKSRKIFQDIDIESKNIEETKSHGIGSNSQTNEAKISGFKTASNEADSASTEALKRSKSFLQESVDSKLKNEEEIVPRFQGFQTASNKKLYVSKEALEKTKKIFHDEDIFETESKSNFVGFQTASNKKVEVSKEALEKTKKIFHDEDIFETESKSNFEGFQTASNKIVEVSKEALEKTKKIFHDEDIFETESKSNFVGFHTASNKKVEVSKEALEKTKKIFHDEDIFETESKSNFVGFQTASNKKVEISKDALEKTKKIFQDEEILNTNNLAGFIGFQTASNKTVKISKDALEKTKNIFQDEDVFAIEHKSDFVGFQTASNKKVSISEDAIAKSKKLFENLDEESNLFDQKVSFKGFQTANNKEVKISEQAFTKSKLLFQNIDNDSKYTDTKTTGTYEERNLEENKQSSVFGFKTANNNNIKISEKALEQSRQIFADLGTDTKIEDEKRIKTDFNIENIIDTQIINNFEKTLNTEDFIKDKTPNKSKRSGSPIISCPKAKKRKKFEIPYSQHTVKNLNEVITKTVEKDIQNTENIFNYDINYKKSKKYSLIDLETLESEYKNEPKNPDPYILKFDYENLLSFEFIHERNDVDNTKWTTENIKNNFLNSINKKLIPEGWIENHLKLILWKLISYEIKFPNTMRGICTVRNVMNQLKYRYDKELFNAVRPALRKVMEKDDVASKTMVLCVVAVCGDDVSGDNATNTIELLLTDGWYCIKAVTDKMLTKLIRDQKIVVGAKLVTNGAELLNCEQGVSPWENTTAIRLKLFGNSTRRARWNARLGYHGAAAILSDLSTVKPEGGKVSRLRAFVCRVYPALYIDKFEDGSTVTRSERLEHLHQMKYEAERQASLEKIYEEVEKEFYDQSNMSQTISLPNSNSKREKLLQEIQTRVQEKMERSGLDVARNVVPLTKVRVAGVEERSMRVTKALLSIWKPNDAIMEMIKEGSWIEIMNVVPTAVRYSELQISAGRQSVFSRSKYKESDKVKPYTKSFRRICYTVKEITKNPSMITEYNEIDIVGLIFQIDPSNKEFDSKKHQFQNVYLTDEDKNIICVNFWGGLKKFGFENVLDTGQIVSCTNLQKRAGNTRKNIPQYRVTEFSYFTKTPKSEDARKIIEDLTKKLYGVDRKRFCEDCAVLKNNYSAVKLQYNNENVSPYRFQNVDINLSRNKIFIDSPLAMKAKNDDNLNLTGLDFESTFKQTDTQDLSPKTLLRKKQVKEKIAKLKMYGETPPLSPINIMNKSKTAGNAFKSPLVPKSDVSSIASEKKILPIKQTIEKEEIQCSPVLNMTYVKRNVNPVKLNFSNSVAMDENNVSDVVDNFAEDFESSPPLSLD